jgi:hypothetical protein
MGVLYGPLTKCSASVRLGANAWGGHHMAYSLAEAAAVTGLHKTSILRALKSGRISGTRDDMGRWSVEPVELHRVFPPAARRESPAEQCSDAQSSEVALLRERIEDLKMLTDEFRVWVRDLSEQRDRAEARATELDRRLLVYQATPSAPPRPWWRRLAS